MKCEIMNEFFQIIRMIIEEQKIPREYGEGHLLYHSELNLIDAIHENPRANARELSEILGITQGAITQVAGKLTDKKLIESYGVEGNRKERYYKITSAGEKVRIGHQEYHEKANEEMCRYFCSLTREETKTILSFFNQLKECMPVSVFPCMVRGECSTGTIRKDESL